MVPKLAGLTLSPVSMAWDEPLSLGDEPPLMNSSGWMSIDQLYRVSDYRGVLAVTGCG
jgi:hypothetical protein